MKDLKSLRSLAKQRVHTGPLLLQSQTASLLDGFLQDVDVLHLVHGGGLAELHPHAEALGLVGVCVTLCRGSHSASIVVGICVEGASSSHEGVSEGARLEHVCGHFVVNKHLLDKSCPIPREGLAPLVHISFGMDHRWGLRLDLGRGLEEVPDLRHVSQSLVGTHGIGELGVGRVHLRPVRAPRSPGQCLHETTAASVDVEGDVLSGNHFLHSSVDCVLVVGLFLSMEVHWQGEDKHAQRGSGAGEGHFHLDIVSRDTLLDKQALEEVPFVEGELLSPCIAILCVGARRVGLSKACELAFTREGLVQKCQVLSDCLEGANVGRGFRSGIIDLVNTVPALLELELLGDLRLTQLLVENNVSSFGDLLHLLFFGLFYHPVGKGVHVDVHEDRVLGCFATSSSTLSANIGPCAKSVRVFAGCPLRVLLGGV
mmetsp:Transcript_39107/g.83216  ORF Transcript_39107/g.83216 Transcript_39107/m.83216 type:complete len:428 (+) Transcript_39107:730-2013(+)